MRAIGVAAAGHLLNSKYVATSINERGIKRRIWGYRVLLWLPGPAGLDRVRIQKKLHPVSLGAPNRSTTSLLGLLFFVSDRYQVIDEAVLRTTYAGEAHRTRPGHGELVNRVNDDTDLRPRVGALDVRHDYEEKI